MEKSTEEAIKDYTDAMEKLSEAVGAILNAGLNEKLALMKKVENLILTKVTK